MNCLSIGKRSRYFTDFWWSTILKFLLLSINNMFSNYMYQGQVEINYGEN